MQDVGVLELVDQDVREAGAVVITQQGVTLEKLIGAQQEFGEIDHTLALALGVVGGIELGETPAVVVGDIDIFRAQPGLLRAIDEVLQIAWRILFVVDIARLEQALDGGELVGRIEDLKGLRQRSVAMVSAQQAIAQAMKGADPHAARIDRQHRRQARGHFARSLVGEGHCQHTRRAELAGLDQPGDPGGEHAGLAAAGAGKDQRVLGWQRDRRKLSVVQIREKIGHPRFYVAGVLSAVDGPRLRTDPSCIPYSI